MKKEVNWGIIGVGDVCEIKSAPAMYKTKHSNLIAVMRRNADKAEDYAKRHGIPTWTTQAEDIINHPEINAIYIATPPKYHKEYAIKVAKAGKACYIEKPMAIRHKDCQEITQVFQDKNLPLFIAYYRTCLPNFLKVKSLLDEGSIGQIQQVQINLLKPLDQPDQDYYDVNWRINPEMAGDGYFYDLGAHQINILEFLIDQISSVKSISKNQSLLHRSNDTIAALIEFQNHVIGTCFWSFNRGVKKVTDELIIYGSKGQISLSCFDDCPIEMLLSDGTSKTFSIPYPTHVQQPIIESIVNDLIHKTNTTYSTGEIGTNTQYWLEKISGLVS